MEKEGKELSHFDRRGAAVMVDVSAKEITRRTALAGGSIVMGRETLRAIEGGNAGKGDVLGTARLAGIMAAKRTGELIPLCHPLSLDTCALEFEILEGPPRVEARCRVGLSARTGAEMEALTGVSTALLTIYDMCKAMDRGMVIGNIRLLEKSGGRSGHFVREEDPPAGYDG
ncbi:MAG: cyclic pyranopterin monophosphate synthase MoaC [Treponema sp.]|jgi:cyclic pyranopterin phosphate synthase|nr:cyclic pyranopterin monophosphate synthase MoaC [Treponema sp.]